MTELVEDCSCNWGGVHDVPEVALIGGSEGVAGGTVQVELVAQVAEELDATDLLALGAVAEVVVGVAAEHEGVVAQTEERLGHALPLRHELEPVLDAGGAQLDAALPIPVVHFIACLGASITSNHLFSRFPCLLLLLLLLLFLLFLYVD